MQLAGIDRGGEVPQADCCEEDLSSLAGPMAFELAGGHEVRFVHTLSSAGWMMMHDYLLVDVSLSFQLRRSPPKK